jgi:hypothetical protein
MTHSTSRTFVLRHSDATAWMPSPRSVFVFYHLVRILRTCAPMRLVTSLSSPCSLPPPAFFQASLSLSHAGEQVFSIFFAAECVVKICALGFFAGPHTYLHDAWNYLDFFIVIIGLLDFVPSGSGSGNLSALRSLRVMRPLRAVTKFPELRFLVVLLLQCIPLLSNVLGLCSFIFFVFGILGVQLFAGTLRGVCYHLEDGLPHGPSPCTLGGGSAICPSGYECLLLGANPERGIVHFDAIGGTLTPCINGFVSRKLQLPAIFLMNRNCAGAIMTIFQVMTLEGW